MSVQMVIELRGKRGAEPILQAIESYKARLRASIERTQRRLAQFEQQYGKGTPQEGPSGAHRGRMGLKKGCDSLCPD